MTRWVVCVGLLVASVSHAAPTWEFETDTAGWTGNECVVPAATEGALLLPVACLGPTLTSPGGLGIDASATSALVLWVKGTANTPVDVRFGASFEHVIRGQWQRAGEEYHELVVPLDSHPAWTGSIDAVRLEWPELFVGSVSIARAEFTDRGFRGAWSFHTDGDALGWTVTETVAGPTVEGGAFKGTASLVSATKPRLQSPPVLSLPARDYRTVFVTVRASASMAGQQFRVWWGTDSAPSLNISRSQTVDYSANGTTQTLRFDVYEHPKWRGVIETLWVQPFVDPLEGATFEIESVAFGPRFTFDAAGDRTAFRVQTGEGVLRHGTGALYGRIDGAGLTMRAGVDAPAAPFGWVRVTAAIDGAGACDPSITINTTNTAVSVPLTGQTCDGSVQTVLLPVTATGRIQSLDFSLAGGTSGARSFEVHDIALLPSGPSFELSAVEVPSPITAGETLTVSVQVENRGAEAGAGPKVIVGGQIQLWPSVLPGQTVTAEFTLGTVATCGQTNLANVAVSGQFPGANGLWSWPESVPVGWLEPFGAVPPSVPATGSNPSAVTTANAVVLENDRVRAVVYSDACLGGFGYLRLYAPNNGTWSLVGERRGLATVVGDVQGDTETWELTEFTLGAVQTGGAVATVPLTSSWVDAEGVAWTVTHELSLEAGSPQIHWESSLSTSALRVLRRFDGPGVTAGDATNPATGATFGGVEQLGMSPVSSNGRWLSTVDADRRAPDPDLVTMPVMAASVGSGQVAVTWDPLQEWSLGALRPQPRFVADGESAWMMLSAPRVHEQIEPNGELGTVDFFVNPGVPVELTAWLGVVEPGAAALTEAVREITGVLGPGALDSSAARSSARAGMTASFETDGWADTNVPVRRSDLLYAASVMAAFDDDATLASQVSAVSAAMTLADLMPSGAGWGGLRAWLMHPLGADAMAAMAGALDEPPEGLSTERYAWTLLQLARWTGFEAFQTEGLALLPATGDLVLPRGGLSWLGVPNGAPDVAACADGVMAAVTAWRLTDDEVWLVLADQYAHLGLQYVLATDLPGVSGSRYSVTMALGSTDNGESLLGQVSDALGARLALAYLELHEEAGEDSWDIVANGILATISARQSALGDGRLAEGYDLRRRETYGESRLGHVFGQALLQLDGVSLAPTVASVDAPGGVVIRVATLGPATATFDTETWSLSVALEPNGDSPQWVFVGGLVEAPPSVKVGTLTIGETESLGVLSTGWDYEAAIEGALIKLSPTANQLNVAFPIPDLDMDQFPANVDCDDNDPDVYPGQAEVCNGKDDNCVDGVDEPEETGFVECGIGQCAHMEPACVNGVFVECDPLFGQSDEICDELDNDCDGETDEEVGTVICGVGQCAHPIYACDECDPFLGQEPEVCDTVDNDCDGETDETPGTVVCGLGACAHVISVCDECDPLLGQGEEVCNLIDDDCDGETDEGQPTVICGVGACEKEIAACAPCDATAEATQEVCNLIDDDCDGETDEDTPTVMCGTGKCERPIPACQACDPLVGAVPEVCNGIDDDCNGITDDAEGLKPCGTGQCYQEIGKCEVCDPTVGAFDEVCDGQDNDCDGETDEIIGTAICGLGVCAKEVEGCAVCNPTEGASPEVCDGLDNDCDGETDEVEDLGTFVCGVGECSQELPNCTDGAQTPCDELLGVSVEVCDGKDNDCDGVTDEDIESFQCGTGQCEYTVVGCVVDGPGACNPLLGSGEEVCDGIDNDCDGETDEELGNIVCGETLGCPQAVPKCIDGFEQFCHPVTGLAPEICDGVDNDCDSFTDEDQPVITCGLGVCLHTVPGCVDGEKNVCDPLEGAGTEICNFADDDCDGETDESAPAVTCGLGACQQTVAGCQNGAPLPCTPLDVAKPDVCNGIDDDCDGEMDENQGDITCGLGECQQTIPLCVDGVVQECDPQTGGVPETCDGLDNDCDGETDEELGTVECGQGECLRTLAACTNGADTVCDPFLGLKSEICDGLDNDCDGETDEGLGNLTCEIDGQVVQIPGCQNGESVTCDTGSVTGTDGADGADGATTATDGTDGASGTTGNDGTTSTSGPPGVAGAPPGGSCSAGPADAFPMSGSWVALLAAALMLLRRRRQQRLMKVAE